MDTFVDSSWYYLRFLDPNNQTSLCQSCLPVDIYVGGIEHSILHLLYARFIFKFLSEELGFDFVEPFNCLLTQGLVEGLTFNCPTTNRFLKPEQIKLKGNDAFTLDGIPLTGKWMKMSKSKHNGVNPMEIIENYGSDVLRISLLFKAPPDINLQWNSRDISGPQRWVIRLLNLAHRHSTVEGECPNESLKSFTENTVGEIEKLIENFKLNLIISSLMKLSNEIERHEPNMEGKRSLKTLALMLHMVAPTISSEILLILKQEMLLTWPRP